MPKPMLIKDAGQTDLTDLLGKVRRADEVGDQSSYKSFSSNQYLSAWSATSGCFGWYAQDHSKASGAHGGPGLGPLTREPDLGLNPND